MAGAKSGRAALAFTAASFGAAGLNYLFQIHAVAVLDDAAFGALSAWLARVTLLGVVATVVQFVSLDHRLEAQRWIRIAKGAGAASLLLLALHVAVGTRSPIAVLGASAVLGGILLYALVGQLQARLELGTIALSVLVAATLRFVLPFAWPQDARGPAFYVAHAASSFAGIAAVGAVLLFQGQAPRSEGASGPAPAPAHGAGATRRLRVRRPVLLAFAAVVFPLLDVLVVSTTQNAAVTGAFSRVALAARIVFFSGAAALQILLPYELHEAETGAPLPAFALRLRRLLTPGALGGAALLGVLLDLRVLHAQGEERTWLYASCLSFALLVCILGHVNRFAAQGRLGLAAVTIAGAIAVSSVAAGLSLLAAREPVSRYVLAALGGNALVLLGAAAAQLRSPGKAA